jgi:PAS domain S-box-containing protein
MQKERDMIQKEILFLSRILPVCSVVCIVGAALFYMKSESENTAVSISLAILVSCASGLLFWGLHHTRDQSLNKKILEARNLYQLIAENTSDVIWILDLDKKVFTYISPSVQKLRGFSPGEIIRQTFSESLSPSSLDYLTNIIPSRIRDFRNGIINSYIDELEQPKSDGTTIWTETTTRYALDDKTGHVMIYGTSRDISKRKAAQEKLHKLYSTTTNIIESIGSPVFSLDLNYCYTSFNRIHASGMKALYGMDIEIGGNLFSYQTVADDRLKAKANIDRALSGESFIEESFSGDIDFSRRYFEISHSPIRTEEGEIIGVTVISRDLTDYKHQEQEIRASNEKYRQLYETLLDAYVKVDLDGKIIDCNKPYLDMLGYPFEELEKLSYMDLTPPKWHIIEEQIFNKQILVRESSDVYEKEYIRKDGTVFPVELRAFLIRDETDKPSAIWGIARDITDRKETEMERDISIKILTSINEPGDLHQLIHGIIFLLQEWSHCEAVGIRLKDGDDFPYFETTGFPDDFAAKETHLCAYDKNGNMIRDKNFNPILDCMCGNVLQGRFDPALPFFTAKGSFWSNNTTTLPATTAGKERQANTRNRCNGEGYESVALIPVRTGNQTLGLIQFNSKTRNQFSLQKIKLFERMAEIFASGLAQRQADIAMKSSEKRFRSLFENMLNGFAYCKMLFVEGNPVDFIYIAVNKSFETLTGLIDVEGRKVSEVIPGIRQTDISLIERYGRVSRSGIPETFETFVESLKMWFSISVYSPENEYFVAVFDVITERKKAEEELKQLNVELENRVRERTSQLEISNRELEAFSYSVSHDLRAPLRGINGWSYALMEDYGKTLDAKAIEYLTRVQNESHRMENIIDDLLLLSRVTRNRISMSAVDLSALAKNVSARMNEMSPDRTVDMEIDPDISINADEHLMEIAMTNLLSNAFKFTSTRNSAKIEIRHYEKDGRKGFLVRDNGVGFDMKYKEKLFGPFQRMHKQSEFPGTGIGLATVQRIINRHGGKIWIDAKVDGGCTIFIVM